MSASHRAPDGSFRNPWPDSETQNWRAVLKMLGERRSTPMSASPPRNSLLVATPEIAVPRASETTIAATWVGHSTVLLQFAGLNLLTDPVFSQRASPVQWAGPRRIMDPGIDLDALPPLDVVLLSHNHYDHLDRPAVKRIARAHPRATWVVPLGVARYIRPWGVCEIVELDWWQTATVDGLRVTATPARHFSARGLRDRNRSLWCGFAFERNGLAAFFAGDTAYHPEFNEVGARCGPFQFVMIPIGAYDPRWFMHVVHVDPEEAVRIYRDLVASHASHSLPLMLCLHWGTFRLTSEPVAEPPRRVASGWRDAGFDEDKLWVARFGETRRVVVDHVAGRADPARFLPTLDRDDREQ